MAESPSRVVPSSEMKFLVPAALGPGVRAWARANLAPDPHGSGPCGDEYQTTSLYFDSPRFDVFHRRGSFGRAKYRIRRYGGSPSVYLERKLRRPNLLVKRRVSVPIDELDRLRLRTDEAWLGAWFCRRVAARGLVPVCQVSYARLARGSETPGGPARLTLDHGVSVAPVEELRFTGRAGLSVLEDQLILELKFRSYLPVIFKSLIEEFQLMPVRASKYRLGMTRIGGDHLAEPGSLESAAGPLASL